MNRYTKNIKPKGIQKLILSNFPGKHGRHVFHYNLTIFSYHIQKAPHVVLLILPVRRETERKMLVLPFEQQQNLYLQT